jgi:enamine deaminase RidA (YjgF/YER057c/UK114 family)
VKLTVFVCDLSKLADYPRARDRFFNSVSPPVAPAVTLVEVSRLYSQRLLIEIEGMAAAQALD